MRLHEDSLLANIILYLYNIMPSLLVLVPALLVVFWARGRTRLLRGLGVRTPLDGQQTGADLAVELLRNGGAAGFEVVAASPPLANFVDVGQGELRLSDEVYQGHGPEALAVAGHESGHAIQAARHRLIFTGYEGLIIALRLGNIVAWMTILAGMLMISADIVKRGTLLYSAIIAVHLLLHGFETNANRLVRNLLPLRQLNPAELAFRRGLGAAAWVEVARTIPARKRYRLPG